MTPTNKKIIQAIAEAAGTARHEADTLQRLAEGRADPEWISEPVAADMLGMSPRHLSNWATGHLTDRFGPCPLTIYQPPTINARRYDIDEIRKLRDTHVNPGETHGTQP